MSLDPVNIAKGAVGANDALPATSGSMLISNAPAIDDSIVINTVYSVTSLAEVVALGIDADYDVTNDVVLYKHFADFYKPYTGSAGPTVWFMLTNASTPAAALDDATNIYARKLVITADGNAWQLALAWNVASGTSETITDGISADLRAAIPHAQTFADWAYSTGRPCHVIIEGRAASSTLTGLINLRAITVSSVVLLAGNVTVCIGQDWDYAEARLNDPDAPEGGTKTHKYAAVGKLLGTISKADINQSVAEVAAFNLSDAAALDFVTAGLSNHLKVKDQDAGIAALDGKGYVFGFYPPKVSGVRWNNDHTCIPITVDGQGNINENKIYYSRTLMYCAMQLKAYLVQLVKTRAVADATTGLLPRVIVKNLEKSADTDVFEKLAGAGLISNGKTTVDPTSDLVDPPNSLLVSFKVECTLIIDNINAKVNLVKSIQI